MAQRASTLGGAVSVNRAPDGGVKVRLRLPLSGASFNASDAMPLMP
jgi:chemotaxis protein histidine kinase CheA